MLHKLPLSSSYNIVLKRAVDIFGATVALILFAIPMLITAIIVKTTSPGPLIFKQKNESDFTTGSLICINSAQ